MARIRGTCVSISGHAVLLRGPSGAGKSDLALRLIDDGARLVADDYTDVESSDGRLFASAPTAIRGLLEVRGLGLLCLDAEPHAAIVAVIDLVASERVARLPEPEVADILGVAVPLFKLAAFEPSAAAKVRLAARLATGGIMPAR